MTRHEAPILLAHRFSIIWRAEVNKIPLQVYNKPTDLISELTSKQGHGRYSFCYLLTVWKTGKEECFQFPLKGKFMAKEVS